MITPTMFGPAAAFIAPGSSYPETSGTVISSAPGEAVGDGEGELTAARDW
jgi:hypothetical protein